MKTKIAFISLLLILTVSCKNETGKTSSKTIVEDQEISVPNTLQLKLNNGEKWLANQETHEGIKNMDSIIKVFKTESKSDYKALAKSLSEQTSYVIKKCDMKGEPHDQLHVVLVPMLNEISVMKDSENKDASENALTKLEKLIMDYFSHFKV